MVFLSASTTKQSMLHEVRHHERSLALICKSVVTHPCAAACPLVSMQCRAGLPTE